MKFVELNKGIIEKGAFCERLTQKEAYSLVQSFNPDVVHELGYAALLNRRLRYGDIATYVHNLQINPSNICNIQCGFCNYAASENSSYAYVMSEDEIFDRIDQVNPTEVHIVGGLNQVWPYSRNLNLIMSLRKRYPALYIKAFTAVEIEYFANTSNCSENIILEELKDSGIDAMTGGGAEIFSDRLYKKYWKNKISFSDWLRIHKIAHEKGISSNATMLFGIGDTWFERVKHLLALRDLQDITGGFSSFIPLPFQASKGNFVMREGPSSLEKLAVLAMSRLILDNIPHIKSYWPMMGVISGAVGLSWGADDMDGTITEEKIAHFAGASTPLGMTAREMTEIITIAGFIPKQRNGIFDFK